METVQVVQTPEPYMMSVEPLLKTQQVAQALGVGASTIKRWVEAGLLEATRTVGNHRRIPLSAAIRFAREKGLPHVNLRIMADSEREPVGPIDDRLREALVEALKRGEGQRARSIIHSVYEYGPGAIALADQVLRPVMEKIGHGWMVGTVDVYQEHQASQIVVSALSELTERASRSREANAPLALGATPEGDPYQIALLAGELVLRGLGWNVRNLGPNLPLRSLAVAVAGYRPRLVFLSVSHLADPDRFVRDYLSFYETASEVGTAVVLGGKGLGPEVRAGLVYASFGERMAHLAELARRLAPAAVEVVGKLPGTVGTRGTT